MDPLMLAKELASRIETLAGTAGSRDVISMLDRDGIIVLEHRIAGALVYVNSLSERKAF